MHQLPEVGFLRLPQIIGNPSAIPPVPPIIPVKKTCWWDGVKSGRYPPAIKLSPRVTVWRVEDIRALVESLSGGRMSAAIADIVGENIAGKEAAKKALAAIDSGSSHPDALHTALMAIWAAHGSPGLLAAHRVIQKRLERAPA